jgi:hypothetical protein
MVIYNIYKWEKQYGDDGSNGRNRRREARMYSVLYIPGRKSVFVTLMVPKAY